MKNSSILCAIFWTAMAVPACGQSVFSIGNSLTWDASPDSLDGDVAWHITCNKNLQYIYSRPESFCLRSSVPWTDAFKGSTFDFVTVQPFTGTSLKKDAEIISIWMQQEPEAQFVLHTGWSSITALEITYDMPNFDGRMRHSMAYFEDLVDAIQENHPDREIISTHAVDMLNSIASDIDAGEAPFSSFSELFRDEIHIAPQAGRYLIHNALRHALDQPFSDEGFDIDAHVVDYLNGKILGISKEMGEPQNGIADSTGTSLPAIGGTDTAGFPSSGLKALDALLPDIAAEELATLDNTGAAAVTTVPEPGSWWLILLALGMLGARSRDARTQSNLGVYPQGVSSAV